MQERKIGRGAGSAQTATEANQGATAEIFVIFFKLGLTAFGGPVAHLGYFRNELVVRRRWIDEASYAELVAVCQFLPGPSSSQVGFCLGLHRRGGVAGGLAAWAGFTGPSALLMLAFAAGLRRLQGPAFESVVHGLKLAAVAVVAQAVWAMARSLAPDRVRAAIALAALVVTAMTPAFAGQALAITLGAAAGALLCRTKQEVPDAVRIRAPSRRAGAAALVAFAALLALSLSRGAWFTGSLALFSGFYRSGALVLGGGHVVLPLLQATVVDPGWVDADTFLAGYGAAQAIPGPLFTLAAYLGAVAHVGPGGSAGAMIALVAIFLPGLLLVYATLPFWAALRTRSTAQAAMRGANAAVVGVLGSALYSPVWTSAVASPQDFAIAATGFVLLTVLNAPPWAVVGLCTLCRLLLE